MPGLFFITSLFIAFAGTNANHCIANDLTVKECKAYVAAQAEPVYKLND